MKQSCILDPSSSVYTIYFSSLIFLTHSDLTAEGGVPISYHLNGKILNLQNFKARTKTCTSFINFQHAHNAAYHFPATLPLQRKINTIHTNYMAEGMHLKADKTETLKYLFGPTNRGPKTLSTFMVGDEILKIVGTFKYLGSILTSSCDLQHEIQD